MAGGIGSRFWPISTEDKPKQFLDILGSGTTLLQNTYKRYEKIFLKENILIVTNKKYVPIVKKQIKNISDKQILAEPMRKNTAPCIAYASFKIFMQNPDAVCLVAPADHLIGKEKDFYSTIKTGLDFASKNNALVTLGIKPIRPDTGYGYIQFEDTTEQKIRKVKTFTEKPKLPLAKKFIESGDFYWNSGMFIWSVKSILNAFKKFLPEMYEAFNEIKDFYNSKYEEQYIEKVYPVCRSISIDYGIMEKADNTFVILCNFEWSDLGTWGSLYTHLKKDKYKNAIIKNKLNNILNYDNKRCIINISQSKNTYVIQGLEDCIVVEANGIVLICKTEDEQRIKEFLKDYQLMLKKKRKRK